MSGNRGRDGAPSSHGTILYQVLDGNTIREQSSTRYNIRTNTYTVVGAIDDNIFEPGEELVIDNMSISNDGGLILPEGCNLAVLPLDAGYLNNPMDVHTLPSMMPFSTANVQHAFRGHLVQDTRPDMDAVAMKRLDARTTLAPCATLLNRPFDASGLPTTLTVQYPIRVESMNYPAQMIRGETGTFGFTLSNISSVEYGPQQSFGTIRYRVFIDPHLLVFDENQKQVTMMEGIVPSILPGQTIPIYEFSATVSPNAKFFDRCKFRVELFLREKKIEIKESDVRITPNFVPMNDTNRHQFDALFVTDSHITRSEFLLYQKIFSGLGIVVNCWDCERFGGFSVESDVTWVDQFKGKLIVFPARTGDDLQRMLQAKHLVSHFVSEEVVVPTQPVLVQDVQPVEETITIEQAPVSPPPLTAQPQIKYQTLDSGFVMIGGKRDNDDVLDHLFSIAPQHPVPPQDMIGYHIPLRVPTDFNEFNKSVCTQLVYDRLEKTPSREFRIYGGGELEPINVVSTRAGKGVLQELQLSAHERFLTIHNEQPTYLSHDIADMLHTDRISVQSRFFAVLFAIVQGLPVERKLALVNSVTVSHGWIFCDDQRGEFTIVDVVKATLYIDLKEEFSFKDVSLHRVQAILSAVQQGKFKDEPTRDAIIETFLRLKSEMIFRSWSPLHELWAHKQELERLYAEIEKLLLEGCDKVAVIREARQEQSKVLKLFSVERPLQSSVDKAVKIYR